MSEVQITESELFAEIDRLEATSFHRRLTVLEYNAIKRARKRGVEWKVIAECLNKELGTKYNRDSLSNKYKYESEKYECGEG